MRISILISIYTVHFAILKMYTKLKTLTPIGAEKSVTEISIGEKKNEQITGLISNMWLFFCYTIQLITIKLYTKFPQVVAEKSLTEKKITDRQTNRQTDKQT